MGQLTASSVDGMEVEAMEDGQLQSANFEVPAEVDTADSWRFGAGLAEVRQVMRREGLAFDEARLLLVRSRMAQMDVDASGMPNDPKTFTFDQLGGAAPKPWRPASTAGGGRTAARRCFSSQQAVPDPASPVQTIWDPSAKLTRRSTCEYLRICFFTGFTKVTKSTRGSPHEIVLRALALLLVGLLVFVLRCLSLWSRAGFPSSFLQDTFMLTQASP
mmetsp:Transcript_15628/g.48638  ORF Transcript_15628/g.48638 Transcript_15628/m.48638 type:complete len:217 (+) Transcript_15628:54-704(+)